MAANEGRRSGDAVARPARFGLRALALVPLLALGFWFVQRSGQLERSEQAAFAQTSGTIRIAELSGPVEILRDDRGIPHIRAATENQGFFGLGFVHAQDRLAQMTRLRRQALGRSAEVEGRAALAADRLARVLEIGRAASEAFEALPVSSQSVLEAYASGVNARMARVRSGREAPPTALAEAASELEAWQPADSLAVVKLLAWCMGGTLETTLVLDELIQRLDSVPARPFFPGGSSVDFGLAPTIPERGEARVRIRPIDRLGASSLTRQLCRGIGIPSGSAWVVGGSVSESGAPMLVADWHLAPTVPALFHEAQIEAGALEVAGASLPGSPIVWAGRNRSVAWAAIPASAPVSDIFIETLRGDPERYQNGKRWVPVEAHEEEFAFRDERGRLERVSMTLRRTRHGPLIEALYGELGSPRTPPGAEAAAIASPEETTDSPAMTAARPTRRSGRALAWTGARAGDGLTSMLRLLRATSASAVVAALEQHHEPVLAFAHADRAGAGGVQVAGWIAKRPLPTGIVPVQGRLRAFEWRKRVPLSELPSVSLDVSGSRNWVVAADQPWPKSTGLDQTEWLWRPGQRAARLEAGLAAQAESGPIDLRRASELLGDHGSDRAPRVVAAILSLARSDVRLSREAEEIAQLLARWEGGLSVESAGAAAYHLVIEDLADRLLRPPFGDRLFDHYIEAPHVRAQLAIESLVLRAAKLRRVGGWTDEETVARAARESLRTAWIRLNHRLGPTRARWSWGGLHRSVFEMPGHRWGAAALFSRSLPAAGNEQSVSVSAHRIGTGFRVDKTSVYRVAMDLASTDHLLSTLTPGQSEHLGHPHFADGLSRHAARRLPLFATNRLVIEEESSERLLLEPAP